MNNQIKATQIAWRHAMAIGSIEQMTKNADRLERLYRLQRATRSTRRIVAAIKLGGKL